MRGLQTKDGVVTNVAVFKELPEGWATAPVDVGVGWTDNGDGTFSAPARPAPEPLTEEDYAAAVQGHMDKQANSMGYDSVFTAVTYADEPSVAKFQQDGQALRAWRSLVWEKCYRILADVKGTKRIAPTIDELIAELPTYGG